MLNPLKKNFEQNPTSREYEWILSSHQWITFTDLKKKNSPVFRISIKCKIEFLSATVKRKVTNLAYSICAMSLSSSNFISLSRASSFCFFISYSCFHYKLKIYISGTGTNSETVSGPIWRITKKTAVKIKQNYAFPSSNMSGRTQEMSLSLRTVSTKQFERPEIMFVC